MTKILKEKGLEVNPEKEFYYNPGEEIEFLGFSYKNGTIDLNKNSIRKIKGKIMEKRIIDWGFIFCIKINTQNN